MGTNLSGRYKLMADIDFTGVPFGNFVIAGTFDGELNGNGFALKGIELGIAPQDRKCAVFAAFGTKAIVHNLRVEGLKITATTLQVQQNDYVDFCGLVHESRARAIFNCHIKNMQADINVNAGGFLRVMGLAFIARVGDGAQGGIRQCSVTGMEIEANQWVSVFGIATEEEHKTEIREPANIRDCYLGPVYRHPAVAQHNDVEFIRSVPDVVKNCYLASEQGWFNFTENLTSCYCDSELGRASTNQYARTTAEMQQQATYVGWDFETVWSIDEGNAYPSLRGESTYVDPVLSAEEYDDLGLSAADFEAKGLTADDYDRFGKIFLG